MSAESPTVVLVHGAFGDASSWAPVLSELMDAGIPARAVANPLRGLTSDGEYVANTVSNIEGPVVLVGHSYGGPVITYASSKASNVKALVYVASFAVDTGESTLASVESFPAPELMGALLPQSYPTADGEPGTEFYVQQDEFARVFAADVPPEKTAIMAISQRPAADIAFGEPLSVEPGWKRLPSWFIVAGADHCAHPDGQRAAAERMGSTTVEIEDGSHAVAISQPERVAEVIKEAVAASR
jgi:pimeloyl-ACP methyl ester carboxylesterase